MKCTLMHKRIATAQMELDETTGFICRINEVLVPEHLPVGVSARKGMADRAALNDWWRDRSIPASRSGIREALEALNVSGTTVLPLRCYGLSLSDQYWIKPEDSGLSWEKINFFDNAFSDDMGDVLFGRPKKEADFDFNSPDNTSDGCLKKRWKIMDGRRCLIKGGSNPFRQQPFNEVIASGIMDRLEIPHVTYRIMWSGGVPYSVCEDFVTADTELVSAWRIMQTRKKDNSTSVYQHFLNCCEELGVIKIQQSIDRMLVLDYLIANEDRHLNNFGLLRNAETLEWLGFAPIYDSGSCLGYDKVASQILARRDIVCKPFKKQHEEQLKLVTAFDWIDFSKLADCSGLITETLLADGAEEFIGEDRVKAIVSLVENRIQNLERIAAKGHREKDEVSIEGDVEENVAADYIG